LSKIIKSWKG